MGAWGTGISSNDTYADVYDQFLDLYDDGLSVSEISARLIRENQETIDLPEDAPNFWFALAKGQWECKALEPDVLVKVEHIIESGEDIAAWRDLGAGASALRSRQKALDKFLIQMRSEKSKPRKRKEKQYYNSIFRKGDCLVYRMENGNYGGAIVLTEEVGTSLDLNYLAITTIDQFEKPVLRDFDRAEVYLRWISLISNTDFRTVWEDHPAMCLLYGNDLDQRTFEIDVIGNLPLEETIPSGRAFYVGWKALQTVLLGRDEYERVNGKPKSKLMLREWIRKPRWRLFG